MPSPPLGRYRRKPYWSPPEARKGQYGSDSLGGELADVMVCLVLLAQILDVDLAQAVSTKIDHLEARNRR